MINEVSAVQFRQNLGEMLSHVQHRNESIVIHKDGRPVAALIDTELFMRIRQMRKRFDALADRIAAAYAEEDATQAMVEIEKQIKAVRKENTKESSRAR